MSRNIQPPRHRSTHAVLRWVTRLLALAVLGAVLAAVAVLFVIPRATHGAALTVLSGSMTPTIPVGSIVVVRPVDPGTLKVGDVATYQKTEGKSDYITHRIVAIDDSTSPTTFTFKGDANRAADLDPVSAKQIRGRVWFHVPHLGSVRDALHGTGGASLLAILALATYAVSQALGAWGDRRATGRITTLDRPVVIATLDVRETMRAHALLPLEVAAQWRAVVVSEDDDQFQLFIVPPRDGLAASVELLETFGARSVDVHHGPVTVTGAAEPPPPAAGGHSRLPRREASRAQA